MVETKNKREWKDFAELEKTIEKQFEIIRDIKEQIVKIGMKETNNNEAITTLINELWTEYRGNNSKIMQNNLKDQQILKKSKKM